MNHPETNLDTYAPYQASAVDGGRAINVDDARVVLSTLRTQYGLRAIRSLDPARSALVLVDFQKEFLSGGLPLPDCAQAVEHAALLLRWARLSRLQVVHVRNVAARRGSLLFAPGSPHSEFITQMAPLPTEYVVTKSMAGAFTRTDLHDRLHGQFHVDTLVVAGLMTHLAVDSTVKDAAVLGYQVVVAADATATRDLPGAAGGPDVDHDTLRQASLAAMADRFADVMTTSQITSLPLAERCPL